MVTNKNGQKGDKLTNRQWGVGMTWGFTEKLVV